MPPISLYTFFPSASSELLENPGSLIKKIPPTLLSVGQQYLSFGVLRPRLNYGLSRVFGNTNASLTLLNQRQFIGLGSLAFTFGLLTTGLGGLGFEKPEELFNDTFCKENPYLTAFLTHGTLGIGHLLTKNNQEELFYGITTGEAETWCMYMALSTIYLPLMGLVVAGKFNPTTMLSGLGLGIIANLSSTLINEKLGDNPTEANIYRQGLLLCMNTFALCSNITKANSELLFSPIKALGIQAVLALAVYGGFNTALK